MTIWQTVADAAEYVKVSPDIIRAAVKSGDLPAYPVGKGREYRLTAGDVDDWMRSRSYEPRVSA
jgi:excisionase family DNA binding protein